jgi:hypothetical protein
MVFFLWKSILKEIIFYFVDNGYYLFYFVDNGYYLFYFVDNGYYLFYFVDNGYYLYPEFSFSVPDDLCLNNITEERDMFIYITKSFWSYW